MSYKGMPAKRGPSGKRSYHSGYKIGNSCDDGEELKFSPKKMLKMQEVDEEQNDDDYDDDDDDDDDEQPHWIKHKPKIRRDCVQKLRDIIEDDDRTKKLLQRYISWMILMAGGKSRKEEKFKDIVKAKGKLEDRLEVAIRVCQSQAWCKRFREDIKKYPEFVRHRKIQGGKISCQACKKQKSYSCFRVKLKGKPYHRQTFERIKTSSEEEHYFMGRMCEQRADLFHKLYHFPYNLFQRCKSMLKVGNSSHEVHKSLDEMCDNLSCWFKEVDDGYTNPAGASVNKQWIAECAANISFGF